MDSLEGFLAALTPDVRELVVGTRGLVLDVFPDADETQDEDNLGFGFGGGYKGLVFTIMPARAWVSLGIFDAVRLEDPEGLLQGSGKRHRHVKVRELADLERAGLRALMEAALAARRGEG